MAIVANRYWILLPLLAAAVVSYGLGFMLGAALLVAAGVCFELVFWFELIRRNRRR